MKNKRLSLADYAQRIVDARVYDVAIQSPLDVAPQLSRRLGNTVWLKREDLQPVFSFKLRGAYNKMSGLSDRERRRGVIAASAGNHAQGVALAAQKLGCRATLVMPVTTPRIKIDAVKQRGATVILKGDTYDEAYKEALRLSHQRQLTFIHPYNDPAVIAGQGTIGMEILRQHPEPIDAIFIAVGGGGLMAGIGAYVKQWHPQTKIIGVEPTDSDAMRRSLAAGRRMRLDHVGLFADGVAVKEVGDETFRVCKEVVDAMIVVDTDAICAAIKDVFEETRSILEPAGALAIAGMKAYVQARGVKHQDLVAVACGANMNFDRLRFVAERAEVGEEREAIFAVTIPERPGSFKAFCRLIGKRNITEFNYRYAQATEAHVFVGVQVEDYKARKRLAQTLKKAKLKALDLTQDEMAKLHLRHLVGGRAAHVQNELLYRFEFPERPGALMKFLTHLGNRSADSSSKRAGAPTSEGGWNISLFHYRNAGADYGRVLVGLQVPPKEGPAFKQFLAQLGYPWVDETQNPAYQLFLA